MTDRLTGSPLPKEGPGIPNPGKDERSQDDPHPRAYESQDRYRRHRTPKTPKTPQTWASEEERDLWYLGQAMSREEEASPTNSGVAHSMNHPQSHALGEDFSTVGARAMYEARQQGPKVALSQQAEPWASYYQLPDDTVTQGEMGAQVNQSRSSHPYKPRNIGEGQSNLDGFSISPSHSIVEQEEPNRYKNSKGRNYDLPQSILKGSRSGKLSYHSRNRQNALFDTHSASPFVVRQQAANLPRSCTNFGSPSGFTPPFNSIQNQNPFAPRPQLSGLFTAPINAMENQHDNNPDFQSYQTSVSQDRRQFSGYSPATGPSNTRRAHLNEAGSSSGHSAQPTDSSGYPLGNPHKRTTNQAREYPRFGANRFANLQEVVDNNGRDSPTSSHHSTISGYKPAHVRYGHGLRSDQPHGSESRDIPVASISRYPVEHRQRFKGMQSREYSGLAASTQNLLDHGYGGDASAALLSQDLEYRREQSRSKSARGFYSPTPFGERPLPPLPQKMRQNKGKAGLGLVVREAQEELELEDEMRNRNFDERGEYVKGIRRLELRKSKSTNFANRSGSPTNYQSRPFTPDVNTPRMASTPRMPPQVPRPQVPRPQPPRPTTALNRLINKASVGSGSDCIARISEVATSTEKIMQEFMAQNMVERFVKSLSKSNERVIIACLKELDSKIDWLGDSLWKGSEDARRLFANQHNDTILMIHTRMIRNLTNLTWDLQRIATERASVRCVKNMKLEVIAVLESIISHLMTLVRSMEPYVGTSMIGNQRAGKGDILVTRFRRCLEAWENLGKNESRDLTPSNTRRSDFS